MTRKPRIVPAVARLDEKPRKATRKQRTAQHRQVDQWQRKAENPEQSALPLDAERREIIRQRLAELDLARMYGDDEEEKPHDHA